MIINVQMSFDTLGECAAFFAKHQNASPFVRLETHVSGPVPKTATSPIDVAPEPAPSVTEVEEKKPRKPRAVKEETAPGLSKTATTGPDESTTNSLMATPEEPAQTEAQETAPQDPPPAYDLVREKVLQLHARNEAALTPILKTLGLANFKEIKTKAGKEQADLLLHATMLLNTALQD